MPNISETLRAKANALQPKIDHLAIPRQINTRKRREEDEHRQRELKKLRTTQRVMQYLATMSDVGGMPAVFQAFPAVTSKYEALVGKVLSDQRNLEKYGPTGEALDMYGKAMRSLLLTMPESPLVQSDGDKIIRMQREIAASNVPGFFPTPRAVADQVIELADIEDGMTVLDPSAGDGALLLPLYERCAKVKMFYCEINSRLRELLSVKLDGCKLLHPDVMEVGSTSATHSVVVTKLFDRIIMNPPFEKGADMEHVAHCFKNLLAPGGRLVAIMSESVFFRDDNKYVEFRRDFLGGSNVVKLEPGAFKSSGTGVSCRIVVLEKESAVQSLDTIDRILAEDEDHRRTVPDGTASAASASCAFDLCARTLCRLAQAGEHTVNITQLRAAMTAEQEPYAPASQDLAWDYLTRVYLGRVATPATASGD